MGHRASECLNKEKATAVLLGTRALGTYALGVCSVRFSCVMVQLLKKSNKIKTKRTSGALLLFESRVWRGSPFLTEEPRRPFLDSSVSNQSRINTTGVGFTFGGETEAAST